MIKKLRRRIMSVTMTSLLITMLLILIVVNSINTATNNGSADDSVERFYHFSIWARRNQEERIANGEEVDGYGEDFYILYEDEHTWQRFITVWYDENGEREQVRLSTVFYIAKDTYITEDQVYKYVERAENINKDSGWIDNMRFGKFTDEKGYDYLVLNYSATERSRIDFMVQSSVITAVVSLVVMFAIALFFSERATRPISKAVEKQKQFVTDASHELKTPLAIISANNEIIEMNHGADDITQSTHSQLARMDVLIQKMLDMSKLDEQYEDAEKERFSLSDAVVDTVMCFVPIAEKDGIRVVQKLEQDIEIESDEAKVRQLIAILVDNAVKYCDPNGKITISLTKGKKTMLQVENSCHNVRDIPLNMLFERFYRGDKARTGGKGFGVGLSIAKSICEICRFDIKVKQSGDDKIVFTVRFN